MSEALDELIAILRPQFIDADAFCGIGSRCDGADGTYGGHFLGQATAAALATVDDDRELHSIHAYFLRPGKPGQPIDYAVRRVRDGRSFCTRRVTASQDGKPAFELTASFTVDAEGELIDTALPQDFEQLPEPKSLPRYQELMASLDPLPLPADWALRDRGVDTRVVNAPWAPAGPSRAQGIRMWIRANGKLNNDSKLHAAMLAYQSDDSVSDCLLVPFGLTWCSPGVFFVSLDHAMWIHRPIDLNEWHFVEQWPVTARRGRGVASGNVWSRDGTLVASFSQEALMRIDATVARS